MQNRRGCSIIIVILDLSGAQGAGFTLRRDGQSEIVSAGSSCHVVEMGKYPAVYHSRSLAILLYIHPMSAPLNVPTAKP
jgi:hypothetical protein